MIRNLCLLLISRLHKVSYKGLKAIAVNNRLNRMQAIETVIQDEIFWMKQWRKGTSYQEHNVIRMGRLLENYNKDWSSFQEFLSKAASYVREQQLEISTGHYQDSLADLRKMSLEEGHFNKEVAFHMLFTIYEAMEQRIN